MSPARPSRFVVAGLRGCIGGVLLAAAVAAQQPPGAKTGNPTPGTPQPAPPNLADRVTLTGCVQASEASPGGRAAAARDPGDVSDARYVLTKAERKNVVPPGTGTSGAAARISSPTYRLRAIDGQLSPFVGTRVEISGGLLPSTSKSQGAAAGAPTLQVEFIQKLAQTCAQP